MKTISRKVYVTDDGREYVSRKDAKNHELLMVTQERLCQYLVKKGDFFTNRLFQLQPMRIDAGFSWYKADDEVQAKDIISLLSNYNRAWMFELLYEGENVYPIYIGCNIAQNKLFFIEEVQFAFEQIEKSYLTLMQELLAEKNE